MKQLINIGNSVIGIREIKTVNARELHLYLESKQEFSHWIKNRIKKYKFVEGVDFIAIDNFITSPPSIDYHLALDMAKELSMVERNEKGKQARHYFIECERLAKEVQPAFILPTNFREALLQLVDQVDKNEQLQITLTEQAPKVEFADTVAASNKSIKIGDFVKLISNKTGFVIGRNNFFEWLRFEKIIERRSMPFQRYIDNGWFEVKEATYENINTNGPQVCFTTLVTGFGQIQLLERFKKSDTFKVFLNKNARMNSQQTVMDAAV